MKNPPTAYRWTGAGAAAVVLALAIWIPISLQRPPEPLPRSAPPTVFSAERAMDHVRAIASVPRPVGSPAADAVRAYLVESLRMLGLEAQVQEVTVVRGWRAARARNVIARIGAEESGAAGSAVLLAAHYDSVATSSGAGDAGAAVAAMLETARALVAGPPPGRDVILLFDSPEESYLHGATAFELHPWADDVGFVVNMDPGGVSGPALMHGTSPENGWLIRQVGRAVPELFATSLAATVKDLIGNRHDDFVVFREADRGGVDVAFIGGGTHYHSRLDRPEALDPASIQSLGSYALGLARHLGTLHAIDIRSPDAIYFNPLGSLFVHYPARWGLPLALVAVALLAAALVRSIGAGIASPRGLVGGAIIHLGATILGVLTCLGVWSVLAGTDRMTGAFLTGHHYQQGTLLLLFVALSTGAATALYAAVAAIGRRLPLEALFLGAQVWWVAFAVTTAVAIPGASYFFSWPVLFTLVATLTVQSLRSSDHGALAAAILVAAGLPALVLAAPLIVAVGDALPTDDAPLLMLLVGLVLGLQLPALQVLSGSVGPRDQMATGTRTSREGAGTLRRWAVPAVAVLVAGFCLATIMAFRFDSAHPRTDFLVYGLDSDSGEAVWASRSRSTEAVHPSDWTAPFFGQEAELGELRSFYPFSSARFLIGPAPALELPPPTASISADEARGGRRLVRLRIRSPREAQILVGVTSEPVLALRIDGRPVDHDQLFAFYGVPPHGFELEVEVAEGGNPELILVDQSYGLPPVDGEPFPSRPPGLMPEPSGGLVFTDATLVRQRMPLASRSESEGRTEPEESGSGHGPAPRPASPSQPITAATGSVP